MHYFYFIGRLYWPRVTEEDEEWVFKVISDFLSARLEKAGANYSPKNDREVWDAIIYPAVWDTLDAISVIYSVSMLVSGKKYYFLHE